MKSTEDFGEYLQQLIDRHREDLSILLGDYGIDEEPTPLMLMALMKKDKRFIAHLANLPEDRADGGFLDTLAKGYELVSRGKEAVNVLKNGSSSGPADPPAPTPKKGWSKKKMIVVGSAVVITLIILIVIVKKFRKK